MHKPDEPDITIEMVSDLIAYEIINSLSLKVIASVPKKQNLFNNFNIYRKN